MAIVSSLDQLLTMADAASFEPIPDAELEATVLHAMRGAAPKPPSRVSNAFPSVFAMGALAPTEKVARNVKKSSSPGTTKKSSKKSSPKSSPKSEVPSPYVHGTALMKPKRVYEAEIAKADELAKQAARYAEIKSLDVAGLLTKPTKPTRPTKPTKPIALQSAIRKRFTTPEQRAEFYDKLTKPPPKQADKTEQEEQRLKEFKAIREVRAEKVRKQRLAVIKRNLDRMTMARIISNGDSNEMMRILADLDEPKSNPTKRAVSKRRQEIAEKRLFCRVVPHVLEL